MDSLATKGNNLILPYDVTDCRNFIDMGDHLIWREDNSIIIKRIKDIKLKPNYKLQMNVWVNEYRVNKFI